MKEFTKNLLKGFAISIGSFIGTTLSKEIYSKIKKHKEVL